MIQIDIISLYQGDEGIRPGEKRRTAQLYHYGRRLPSGSEKQQGDRSCHTVSSISLKI